jgi:exosome complex component CSL4
MSAAAMKTSQSAPSTRPPTAKKANDQQAAAAAAAVAASHTPCWVTPGQLLGSSSSLQAGAGCYVLPSGEIHSGVVGVKQVRVNAEGKPFVSVESVKPPSRLPAVGDVVTCRVIKITQRMAMVDILVLHPTVSTLPEPATGAPAAMAAATLSAPAVTAEPCVLDEALAGTIRQRDIRAHDIDSVEVYKCFRPNDLVKAQVLSLGDARSYFLSTARNDLGVILATATSGATMVPINWQQMQCPLTGAKEFRKVAKIDA